MLLRGGPFIVLRSHGKSDVWYILYIMGNFVDLSKDRQVKFTDGYNVIAVVLRRRIITPNIILAKMSRYAVLGLAMNVLRYCDIVFVCADLNSINNALQEEKKTLLNK